MSGVFKLIGIVAVLCMPSVSGIQFSLSRNQVELNNPTDPVLTFTCNTDVNGNVLVIKIQREDTARTGWQPLASLTSTEATIAAGLPTYWSTGNVTGEINSKSLSLDVQASSLTCEDERTYQCEVTYLDSSLATRTEVQNSTLQITAMPSTPTLSAKDMNTNMPINFGFSESSPASMDVGQQIELTCVANIGSDNSRTIRWQKSSEVNAGQMIDFTGYKDDGTATQNTGTGNGCTYARTSIIRYNTTVIDSNRGVNMDLRFSCFFLVNQQETQQMFYIDVAGGSAGNTDTSVNNAGASSAGVIAGAVIGGLVLVVIIALLVYFLWYRRRSTGSDYKTKEEYGSENPNMAPPPSDLYATPNKPKKKKNSSSGGEDSDDPLKPKPKPRAPRQELHYAELDLHQNPPKAPRRQYQDAPVEYAEQRRGHENRGLDEPHESNSRRHDDYNGRSGKSNYGMKGDDDEFENYDSRDGSPTLTDRGIHHMGVDPVNLSIGTGV